MLLVIQREIREEMPFPTWIVKAKGELRRRLSRGESGISDNKKRSSSSKIIKESDGPNLSGAGDLAPSSPTASPGSGRVSE